MWDIKTPVLILHGEEDERVPVAQDVGFHRGMLAKKRECEMVTYPREGHRVGGPKHGDSAYAPKCEQ